jgi:pyridoxine/pyridoxamine 5'-phosphate oxidase
MAASRRQSSEQYFALEPLWSKILSHRAHRRNRVPARLLLEANLRQAGEQYRWHRVTPIIGAPHAAQSFETRANR